MATTTQERPNIMFIPPTYSFLFERAEHFLQGLMPGKERFGDDRMTQEIVIQERVSSTISIDTLDNALALKALKKRVRVGMLLHLDLVDAMNRLSTKPGRV